MNAPSPEHQPTEATDEERDVAPAQLERLFGHLSDCSGLYSKETFLSLVGCVVRMIRDHRMQGLVLTRTLGDTDFEAILSALAGRQNLTVVPFDGHPGLPASAGLSESTGFVMVLTDRQCATLYWNVDARKSFQMYQGGWTFHPSDCRTIATNITRHLKEGGQTEQYQTCQRLLEETPIDRRYDEKLTTLVTALVNGLETQSRDLVIALQQVQDLNKRMVEQERLAAIGQLCSVIAHEIRNPLGLIDLYAKLIEAQMGQLADAETPEAKEEAQEKLGKNITLIRQSIESLESILSELTNYSRPLQLDLNTHDLNQVVKDVCTFYTPSFEEKGVTLTVKSNRQGELPLCLDAARIRQALINLLKNALEVSGAGTKVTVTVATRKTDDKVYIKVQDQGCGINERTRAKLFTPYFSTKRNGTGLGLAHSRKILQAHGGSVELLATTPDEGSTFALVLPKNLTPDSPLMASHLEGAV